MERSERGVFVLLAVREMVFWWVVIEVWKFFPGGKSKGGGLVARRLGVCWNELILDQS